MRPPRALLCACGKEPLERGYPARCRECYNAYRRSLYVPHHLKCEGCGKDLSFGQKRFCRNPCKPICACGRDVVPDRSQCSFCRSDARAKGKASRLDPNRKCLRCGTVLGGQARKFCGRTCRDASTADRDREKHRKEERQARAEGRRRPTPLVNTKAHCRRYWAEGRYTHSVKASRAVQKALKSGVLVRPDACSMCGESPPPTARGRSRIEFIHTEGYGEEFHLVGKWVCRQCRPILKLGEVEKTVPKTVFVYFIQGNSGGPIKIGASDDIVHRVTQLQQGNPQVLLVLGKYVGSYREEKLVHLKFKEFRLRKSSEWFKDTPEIRGYIAQKCSESSSHRPELSVPVL